MSPSSPWPDGLITLTYLCKSLCGAERWSLQPSKAISDNSLHKSEQDWQDSKLKHKLPLLLTTELFSPPTQQQHQQAQTFHAC